MARKSTQKQKSRSVKSTGSKDVKKKKRHGKSQLYMAMTEGAKVWFVEKHPNGKEEATEIPQEVVLQCVVDVLTRALEEWANEVEAKTSANKPTDTPSNTCSDHSTPSSGGNEPRVDAPVKPEGQIVTKQPKLRKTDN